MTLADYRGAGGGVGGRDAVGSVILQVKFEDTLLNAHLEVTEAFREPD